MSIANGGLNYFTCTLAQAAEWRHENSNIESFDTVIDLIDKQAELIPSHPGLGFSQLKSDISATSFGAFAVVSISVVK